jgi:hypothetical protein
MASRNTVGYSVASRLTSSSLPPLEDEEELGEAGKADEDRDDIARQSGRTEDRQTDRQTDKQAAVVAMGGTSQRSAIDTSCRSGWVSVV